MLFYNVVFSECHPFNFSQMGPHIDGVVLHRYEDIQGTLLPLLLLLAPGEEGAKLGSDHGQGKLEPNI